MKPIGRPGSWFADWNGTAIPCGHSICVSRTNGKYHYYDRVDDHPKWLPFIDAVRLQRQIILTTGEKDKQKDNEGHAGRRTGYIALFDIDNVEHRNNELHFDLVKRVVDFD